MKTFLFLILLLMLLVPVDAAVFPASTNGNNVFTGSNTFAKINISGTLTGTGLAMANTAYVRTAGNDSTAQLGQPGAPYATLEAAAAALTGGGTLNVGPGTFRVGATLNLTNVNFVGSGRYITIIQPDIGSTNALKVIGGVGNNYSPVHFEGTCSMSGVTLDCISAYLTNALPLIPVLSVQAVTNHFVDCYISGGLSSAIFKGGNHSGTTWNDVTFYNCELVEYAAGGDVLIFDNGAADGTNSLSIINSKFVGYVGAPGTLSAGYLIQLPGTIYIQGCRIISLAGNTGYSLVQADTIIAGDNYYQTSDGNPLFTPAAQGAGSLIMTTPQNVGRIDTSGGSITYSNLWGGITDTVPMTGLGGATLWLHYTNGIFYGATTNSP